MLPRVGREGFIWLGCRLQLDTVDTIEDVRSSISRGWIAFHDLSSVLNSKTPIEERGHLLETVVGSTVLSAAASWRLSQAERVALDSAQRRWWRVLVPTRRERATMKVSPELIPDILHAQNARALRAPIRGRTLG